MNTEENTTVVYNFADGSKQVQPINIGEHYFNPDYRTGKKIGAMRPVEELFADIAADKGRACIGYSLEGINIQAQLEPQPKVDRQQIKNAKRDYKEFKEQNPKGFQQDLNAFKSMLVDKIMGNQRRIHMNVSLTV